MRGNTMLWMFRQAETAAFYKARREWAQAEADKQAFQARVEENNRLFFEARWADVTVTEVLEPSFWW